MAGNFCQGKKFAKIATWSWWRKCNCRNFTRVKFIIIIIILSTLVGGEEGGGGRERQRPDWRRDREEREGSERREARRGRGRGGRKCIHVESSGENISGE